MIKLTTTQAKAVASKIREKILAHNEQVKKELVEKFINSDDYKNKQVEIHDTVVTVWQTSLKIGLKLGIGTSNHYSCCYMYKEEDIQNVENKMLRSLQEEYISANYTCKNPPSEDQLVTDLIFESLTSEGIEELMEKFINQYL